MSTEEILESTKRGEITLWRDKQIDFSRYPTLQELIHAYKKGDPWEPDSILDVAEYLNRENGLSLPLNTKGVLRVGRPQYERYNYVIMNRDSKPLRQGHQDFVLEKPNAHGKLKIMKGKHYLLNTSVVLGLRDVVGEIVDGNSEITGLETHSTSKFLDSDNINAPVCELLSNKIISITPKNTVQIKFEEVHGAAIDESKDSTFSFQQIPHLPRWYDETDHFLVPLWAARRGIKGHPQEKKIYR
jgi:hypothetical protein